MAHVSLPAMPFGRHLFAYITLGLLCGWYYFLLVLLPTLCFFAIFFRSMLALFVLVALIVLSVYPLNHKPWIGFMNCWIFDVWREYFDFTANASTLDNQFLPGRKLMFFEFPHGVFPMGQFLSASLITTLFPGQMICGTGADIIFYFPVMRQIMAWLGTRPARRKNISKIFSVGHHCAIVPGGIAEMYLMNSSTEEVFLRKRRNTVKVAIQEGADIVPVFFFGNSRLFNIVGGKSSNSWLSQLSRRLRMSLIFFYGRHYLPVPFRHPLHMQSGNIVCVKQCDNPSDDQIDEVLNKLTESVQQLYSCKPDWEDRPLVIH